MARTFRTKKTKWNKTLVRSSLTSSLHYTIVARTMDVEYKESRPLGKFPYNFFYAPCGKGGEAHICHAEESGGALEIEISGWWLVAWWCDVNTFFTQLNRLGGQVFVL